jgi:hypothetical protein
MAAERVGQERVRVGGLRSHWTWLWDMSAGRNHGALKKGLLIVRNPFGGGSAASEFRIVPVGCRARLCKALGAFRYVKRGTISSSTRQLIMSQRTPASFLNASNIA